MATHVYLVRHGESNANVDGIHRGSEAVLTDLGREQARIVAERVQKIGVDAILSSPYPRTRETAETIANAINLPIEESELLVERRRPSFVKGRTTKDPEVRQAMIEIFDGYLTPGHRHSDEENLDDIRERVRAALDLFSKHPAEKLCVVTHGLFMRFLVMGVLDPEFDGRDAQRAIDGFHTDNTGITYFRHEPRFGDPPGVTHWRIVSWNDSAHLG